MYGKDDHLLLTLCLPPPPTPHNAEKSYISHPAYSLKLAKDNNTYPQRTNEHELKFKQSINESNGFLWVQCCYYFFSLGYIEYCLVATDTCCCWTDRCTQEENLNGPSKYISIHTYSGIFLPIPSRKGNWISLARKSVLCG